MTKTRLITLLLTLALALTMAPAALAQDESPAPEGDAGTSADSGPFDDIEEQEAAVIAFADYERSLLAIGVPLESLDAATDWLQANAPDPDMEEPDNPLDPDLDDMEEPDNPLDPDLDGEEESE